MAQSEGEAGAITQIHPLLHTLNQHLWKTSPVDQQQQGSQHPVVKRVNEISRLAKIAKGVQTPLEGM